MTRGTKTLTVILFVAALCAGAVLSKAAQTTKLISVYTETEAQGLEFAVCRVLSAESLIQRTREFEANGEPWGHAIKGNKEIRTLVLQEWSNSVDGKAKTQFMKSLREIMATNRNAGQPFFTKEGSRVTLEFKGWEANRPSAFVYEADGKLYRGTSKARGLLQQSDKNGKPFIEPREIVDVKKFLFTRNSQNYHGITYQYIYSGEIHIPKANIATLQAGAAPKVAIVQSLYPTHFADKYEMQREHPEIVRFKVTIDFPRW